MQAKQWRLRQPLEPLRLVSLLVVVFLVPVDALRAKQDHDVGGRHLSKPVKEESGRRLAPSAPAKNAPSASSASPHGPRRNSTEGGRPTSPTSAKNASSATSASPRRPKKNSTDHRPFWTKFSSKKPWWAGHVHHRNRTADDLRANGTVVLEEAEVEQLVAEMNHSRLEDEDNPFRNVLLVVHCRMGSVPAQAVADLPEKAGTVCARREHLFESYKMFFPDVLYLTPKKCPKSPGNPHRCLVEVMKDRAAGRDGIFYMHFDAMIKPQVLGRDFNTTFIYTFGDYDTCGINATGYQVDCDWNLWSPMRAEAFQSAVAKLRNIGPSEFRNMEANHFYLGNDDIFYIPRSVFPLYIPMAIRFEKANVHHEYGGPTMRHILHNLTSVPIENLRCAGDCCSNLDEYDALSPDFRCGHAFNLSSPIIQDVIPKAILLK